MSTLDRRHIHYVSRDEPPPNKTTRPGPLTRQKHRGRERERAIHKEAQKCRQRIEADRKARERGK